MPADRTSILLDEAQAVVRAAMEKAEEIGTGLIVMGSRGYGPIRQALIGSVSDSVVRHAHCPVMVVRIEKERTVEHEADLLT